MSVYKQGKAWMVEVNWPHPDGRVERIRKTSPVQTRKGAEAYERELRNSLANGTWQKEKDHAAPTLEAFKERYFQTHVATLRKAVQGHHESIWREHLIPELGEEQLNRITSEDLSRLVAKRQKMKPKSRNNILSSLNTALGMAASWGVIDRAAIPQVPWQRVPQQRFDFFTFDEAARIIVAIEDERPWGPLIKFAINTGLRTGELRALRWHDFSDTHVTVSRAFSEDTEEPTKTGLIRSVPLNKAAREALGQLKRGARKDFVFGKLTAAEMKWPLWRACDRAKVGRRVGWHTTRHTFASHLVMRAVPLAVVQQLLGHTTIQMTMRYAHLAPGHLESAVASLD